MTAVFSESERMLIVSVHEKKRQKCVTWIGTCGAWKPWICCIAWPAGAISGEHNCIHNTFLIKRLHFIFFPRSFSFLLLFHTKNQLFKEYQNGITPHLPSRSSRMKNWRRKIKSVYSFFNKFFPCSERGGIDGVACGRKPRHNWKMNSFEQKTWIELLIYGVSLMNACK